MEQWQLDVKVNGHVRVNAVKGVDCTLDEHCEGDKKCCKGKYGNDKVVKGKCAFMEWVGDKKQGKWWCPIQLGTNPIGTAVSSQVGCGNNESSGAHKCKSRWACNGKCATKGTHCSLDEHCTGINSCCINKGEEEKYGWQLGKTCQTKQDVGTKCVQKI